MLIDNVIDPITTYLKWEKCDSYF